MSDATPPADTTKPPTAKPPTAKKSNPKPAKKKAKAAATPRAPRKIDPGIEAIRQRASKEIEEYRKQKGSAGILATIINKRLPQLNARDKAKLFDVLKDKVTPPLPMTVESNQ